MEIALIVLTTPNSQRDQQRAAYHKREPDGDRLDGLDYPQNGQAQNLDSDQQSEGLTKSSLP